MSLLKDKRIDSKELLMELDNLLNGITVCGAPAGTNKNAFMTEVINLKIEARKLLDEINQNTEGSPHEKRISNSSYTYENIFEAFSFKERVNDLKERYRYYLYKILL